MKWLNLCLACLLLSACAETSVVINGKRIEYATADQATLSRNTVRIFNSHSAAICAGTVVNYNDHIIIVTAAHCVRGPRDTSRVVLISTVENQLALAAPVAVNKIKDVAVLAIITRSTDDENFLQCDGLTLQTHHRVGEDVTAVGHPLLYTNIISKGYVAASSIGSPTGHILITSLGYYGCSGGGVFNTDNELIGVFAHFVAARDKEQAPFPFITPASDIVKLLEDLFAKEK